MGVRTRRARKHSRTHIIGFGAAGILGFVALLTVALSFSLGSLISSWLENLPDYTSADAYLVAEPTQVFDSEGNRIAEYYLQNRKSVTIDAVSPYVLSGTVDTEDVRFYQHNGVDPQGIVRAMFVQMGGGSEGASTITQQLVRNTVLSDEQFEISIKRKVREAYIAVEMEKVYTKEQILMMYLNTIYYGHSAYGIEAASITYLNKSAKDLTLAEAALLVGLPNSPTSYDPTVNPNLAVQRRNVVLDRMLTAGDITKEEHDAAQAEELHLNLGSAVMDSAGTFPFFTDYVKDMLLDDFDNDTILQGGLKVYTTIEPACQRAAEDAVNSFYEGMSDDELQSALVAVDVNTGYIKAMVGGRDYNNLQFNLATQAQRQPGSSFKAVTLAAALNEGMNPNIYLDCSSPLQVTPTWKVQNYGNSQYGTISLKRATELSSNTGYAQVATAIGYDKVAEMGKTLGIDVDLPGYASLTLGSTGIPVNQMAEAYATIASGGLHRDAIAITKICDRNDNVVYEHKDNPEQVIPKEVAVAETDVLEGVLTNSGATGSQFYYSYYNANQPAAGKTGTTEDYRDLWFVGYTPQISCAVWTGYTSEETVRIGGTYGHPYTTSGPIWAMFMSNYLNGRAREEFPTADAPEYKPNSYWDVSRSSSSRSSYDDSDSESASSGSSSGSSSRSTQENAVVPSENTQTETQTQTNTDTSGTGTGGNAGGGGGTTGGGGGESTGGGGGGQTGGGGQATGGGGGEAA